MKLTSREKTFVARFFGSFVAIYAVISILPLDGALQFLALVEARMLALLGVSAQAVAALVVTPSTQFEIVRDCSGLVMVGMLAALLYATGSKNAWRTFLLYSPLLLVFNVLRLLGTLYAGALWGATALALVHFSFWMVDGLLVIAVWAHSEKISLGQTLRPT